MTVPAAAPGAADEQLADAFTGLSSLTSRSLQQAREEAERIVAATLGVAIAGWDARQRPEFAGDVPAVWREALTGACEAAVRRARFFEHSERIFDLRRQAAGGLDEERLVRLSLSTAASLGDAQRALLLTTGGPPHQPRLVVRASHPEEDVLDEALVERARQIGREALRSRRAAVSVSDGLIAAPVTWSQRLVGALVVQADRSPALARLATRLQLVADDVAQAAQAAWSTAQRARQARRLSMLKDVSRECGELGLDRLLPSAAGRACEALDLGIVAFAFHDPDSGELVTAAVSTPDGPERVVEARTSPRAGAGLAQEVVASGSVRRGPAATLGLPDVAALAAARGLDRAACVPLMVRGRTLGVLCALRAERALSDEELRPLSAIASQVALAIENERLEAETRRRAAELESVKSIGDAIARSLDARQIRHEAAVRLVDALSSDLVRIYAAEEGVLRLRYAIGDGSGAAADGRLDGACGALAARVAEAADVDVARLDAGEREAWERLGVARLAAAPLSEGSGGSGLVVLGRRAPRPFGDSERQVLSAVALHLSLALENARLFEQTRRQLEDLAVVAEVSKVLVGERPLGEALGVLAERFAHLARVRSCVVLLADPAERVLRAVATVGTSVSPEQIVLSQNGDEPAVRALRERRPIVDTRVDEHPLARNVTEQKRGPAACWVLNLPLIAGEVEVGVVALADEDRSRLLDAREMARFEAICRQVALSVERARLNAELEQAHAQLVRRERLAALGEMSALVAHEIRNPLGVITNSLGSLRKLTRLQGDASRVYDILVEEAARLNRIVDDMLDYTRPLVARPARCEVRRLLAEAVSAAQQAGLSHGMRLDHVRLDVQVDPALPELSVDARLLHRALVNLVTNALESVGGQPAGRVVVSASRVGRCEGDRALLCVSDDGPGVAPELEARLYDPFFTTKALGSGLGLAVVRRIAEEHGGSVRLERPEGGGACLVLDLPVDAVA